MKKILLINSPLYNTEDKRLFLPLGISYLCSSLRKNDFYCDVMDANLFLPSIDDIVLGALKYDFIGISTNTLNFDATIKISEGIKNKKNIPVVIGGHHATFLHESILKNYKSIDAVIRGEGEEIIPIVCREFFKNGGIEREIKGVSYRDKLGKLHFSDKIVLLNSLDNLAFPARDNQQFYPRHRLGKREGKLYVSVLTSRGCPYGCKFCSVTSFRRNWICRKPYDVANEVYQLYRNYRNIFLVFADDNFFIDPERSKRIVELVRGFSNDDIKFSFSTRADQIVNNGIDYLDFFKNNGCYSIELGIENGSDSVLRRYGKRTSVDINKKAIEMIRSSGIYLAADYILFDRNTTLNELKENIAFMRETRLFGHHPSLLTNRMKPYPGTEFAKEYNEHDNYFYSDDVKLIYNLIKEFEDRYSRIIDSLVTNMDILLKSSEKSNYNIKLVSDYMWVRTLPYRLFEAVIMSDDFICSYDEYIRLEDVDRKLNLLNHEYKSKEENINI